MLNLLGIGKGLLNLFGGGKTGAMGLTGALLGAFGTNQKTSGWEDLTSETSSDIWRKAVEPDYFTGFRQELIRRFLEEMDRIPAPSLQARQADIVQQTNQLAQQAVKAAQAALARMGRLDSGAASTTISNIMGQVAGQRAQLLTDLPFQLAKERASLVSPFLQMGAGWTGQAPVSIHQVGSETTRQKRQYEASGGVPYWRSALGGLGGAIGANYFRQMW